MVGFGGAIVLKEWTIAVIFFGLSLIMIGPIVKYQMSQKVVVLSTSINDEESFIVRRKDELLVALAAALVGALVSFLLFKYFGQA